MTTTDIFNTDYTKLNHCYIEIYNTYKKLAEAEDITPDNEILDVLGRILTVMNPVLDEIKSKMTVKTRVKESSENPETSEPEPDTGKKKTDKAPFIFHGNFTGE